MVGRENPNDASRYGGQTFPPGRIGDGICIDVSLETATLSILSTGRWDTEQAYLARWPVICNDVTASLIAGPIVVARQLACSGSRDSLCIKDRGVYRGSRRSTSTRAGSTRRAKIRDRSAAVNEADLTELRRQSPHIKFSPFMASRCVAAIGHMADGTT